MPKKTRPLSKRKYKKDVTKAKSRVRRTQLIFADMVHSHRVVQSLRNRVMPELGKNVTVVEVGLGEGGLSPYFFAHMLEQEKKDYKVIAIDVNKKVLKSVKNAKEFDAGGFPWSAALRSFKEAVKHDPRTDRISLPKRWKNRIKFTEMNILTQKPKVRGDIVNATRFMYTIPHKLESLAFQHLVDMVKPGGFLHTDYVPTNRRLELLYTKVKSREQVEKHLDYESYGLKLVHAREGYAIFQKLE